MAVDQIIGKTDFDLLSPAEARRVVEIKKEFIENQGAISMKKLFHKLQGARHHFSMYYQAWRDTSGNILGIATYTRDINEQKLAENNLKQQLEGEELVAAISSQFINAEIAHIDDEIPAALQKMANYLDADRGFIRFINQETDKIQRGFEWKDPKLAVQKIESNGLPLSTFEWSYKQLKNNQPVYISESIQYSTGSWT